MKLFKTIVVLSSFVLANCGGNEGETETECTEGAKRCQGSLAQACLDGNWTAGTDCTDQDQICVGGACRDKQVTEECNHGDTRCAGTLQEECFAGSWSDPFYCASFGQVCKDGVCTDDDQGPPEGCPILASDLKVELPYVSTSPITVVATTRQCESNGVVYFGPASVLKTLEDRSEMVSIQQLGSVVRLEFVVGQRSLSTQELQSLSVTTGIEVDDFNSYQEGITTRSESVNQGVFPIGYQFAEEVWATAMIPSSDDDGFIIIQSTDVDELSDVFSDLAQGIEFDLPMQKVFSGGSDPYASFTLRVRLNIHQPRIEVLSLTGE